MAVTNYYTANGVIIAEHTTGQSRLDYVTDALGSVIATVDQTLTVKSTARYKPYGAVLSETGTQPMYGWVGSPGCRRTGLPHSDVYARARGASTSDGRWTTVDPLWPNSQAYLYASANPCTLTDPSGYRPRITVRSSTPDRLSFAQMNDCYAAFAFQSGGNAAVLARYNACMASSGVSCPPMTQSLAKCLYQHICNDTVNLSTLHDNNTCGWTNPDRTEVTLCPYQITKMPYCDHYHAEAQYHIVLLHEMLHVCGVDHPNDVIGDDKCNNVMACCMLRATGFLGPSTRCTSMISHPG